MSTEKPVKLSINIDLSLYRERTNAIKSKEKTVHMTWNDEFGQEILSAWLTGADYYRFRSALLNSVNATGSVQLKENEQEINNGTPS